MSDDKEKLLEKAREELKRKKMERKAHFRVSQMMLEAICDIEPRERTGAMRCLKAYSELTDSLQDCIDVLHEQEVGDKSLEPALLNVADELEAMIQQMTATLNDRFPDMEKVIAEIRQTM